MTDTTSGALPGLRADSLPGREAAAGVRPAGLRRFSPALILQHMALPPRAWIRMP